MQGVISDWVVQGVISDWVVQGVISDWVMQGVISDWVVQGVISDWVVQGVISSCIGCLFVPCNLAIYANEIQQILLNVFIICPLSSLKCAKWYASPNHAKVLNHNDFIGCNICHNT